MKKILDFNIGNKTYKIVLSYMEGRQINGEDFLTHVIIQDNKDKCLANISIDNIIYNPCIGRNNRCYDKFASLSINNIKRSVTYIGTPFIKSKKIAKTLIDFLKSETKKIGFNAIICDVYNRRNSREKSVLIDNGFESYYENDGKPSFMYTEYKRRNPNGYFERSPGSYTYLKIEF